MSINHYFCLSVCYSIFVYKSCCLSFYCSFICVYLCLFVVLSLCINILPVCVCMPSCLSFVYIYIYIERETKDLKESNFLSFFQFVCIPFCLSFYVCLFFLSVLYLSFYLYLSIYLSVFHSMYLCLSACFSVHLCLFLSFKTCIIHIMFLLLLSYDYLVILCKMLKKNGYGTFKQVIIFWGKTIMLGEKQILCLFRCGEGS